MTKKFEVVGGPSREDLFDCLRLADDSQRMFPVTFRVKEVEYPLIIKTIQSLEYSGSQFAVDRADWIIRSRGAHIVSHFQSPGDPDSWPKNYQVKIVYNTKTRRGTAFVTRVRSAK